MFEISIPRFGPEKSLSDKLVIKTIVSDYTGTLSCAGTITYSAWLERRMENPITSSPTVKPLTPGPRSATAPAKSLP